MEHSCTEDKFKLKLTVQLKRWYRWRYSGPITVFSIVIIAVIAWQVITSQIEFWDKFTCPEMMEYKNGDYGVYNMPDYDELDDIAKAKFDGEYNKCLDQGWAPR